MYVKIDAELKSVMRIEINPKQQLFLFTRKKETGIEIEYKFSTESLC